MSSERTVVALKWTGIVVGSLVALLVIAAVVLDANADALRGPIAKMASARLGRTVRLEGRLELHLLSWTPRIVIRQLSIANPDWAMEERPAKGEARAAKAEAHAAHGATAEGLDPQRRDAHPGEAHATQASNSATSSPAPDDMARIGEIKLALSIPALLAGQVLLPYVEVENTDINLLRDSGNRANWEFTTSGKAKSTKPAKLPIVRSLHLGRGHLTVKDAIRKLHFAGEVTADQAANGGALSLQLTGKGNINGAPFQLTASGDPLITAEHHKPYTVNSDIRAGRTHVSARITIEKPFDMGSLVADFSSQGDDLADLYYLSGLALPNTAPYTVSSHLQREGESLKLTDFKGTLGHSDIRGTLSIDTSAERPVLTADLATRLLDIKDLGPTLGARGKNAPSSLSRQQAKAENPAASTAKARAAAPDAVKTAGAQAAPDNKAQPAGTSSETVAQAKDADSKAAKGESLLPDAKLDLQRVRGMDASVKYRADAVKTEKMSIRAIALSLKLDHGVMTFDPLSFELPQGKLVSNIRVNGAQDVPQIDIDSRISNVQLAQFHGKDATEAQAPLDGTMVGRAILQGRGKSVHELASTAEGTLTVVVPHGDIREAFAELMGINAARGLGLLLNKNEGKTPIRCGVANFKAQGGVFAAQDIVIDTQNVLITGKGEIDLGPEILDLQLNGQPKKLRLFRIKSPIVVGGTLSKPKVGLKAGNTPGQAAIAAALAVVATPLAAALAFIDPGLAKDADCGSLLEEAQRHGAPAKDATVQAAPAPAAQKNASAQTALTPSARR